MYISVTDCCDLSCSYCINVRFADYAEAKDWLAYDEIERVVKAFAALGVGSIRLNGGEPLIRKDIPLSVPRISQVEGINDISLSTNAPQLEKHALALKSAGLNRLNISMDSLNSKRFSEIYGRDA